MTDTLQRFIFKDTSVRGEIIKLNQSLKTILKQNQFPEAISTLLGETLLAAGLLSTMLKYEGELTVQFQGTGPLSMLVAKCDNQYRIRGTAKWDEAAASQNILSGFEAGQLVVTIKNNIKNQQYQSIVDINHQSIAESLETYFHQSEQLETKFWLAYDHHTETASGFLLQKLPTEEKDIEAVHQWEHIQTLANTLTHQELLSVPTETLLQNLFHEETIQLFEPHPVHFYCPCNAQKMLSAITVFGEAKARDILSTNRFIEVTCEYCNNHFEFNADEINRLFTKH